MVPDPALVRFPAPEITPENESDSLGDVLERLLQHDKDYPELFGAGKLSADEIFQDLMAQIPGAKEHELGLRRVLYQKLAHWNPKPAVEWASAHLPEADLLLVSMKADGMNSEPRASRMLDLMEKLPLKFEEGRYVGFGPWVFHRSLLNWVTLDAEAANLALNRSPEAKDIAEKITKMPSSEDSPDVLPPLTD